MAMPAFGERWAQVWLDLARYADSNGYAEDQPRTIWKFRDWVIKAINANMPFDRFTIEQIAGDMLPNPTTDQIIATAFHRNTLTNTEGRHQRRGISQHRGGRSRQHDVPGMDGHHHGLCPVP